MHCPMADLKDRPVKTAMAWRLSTRAARGYVPFRYRSRYELRKRSRPRWLAGTIRLTPSGAVTPRG
ncbi:hypothetical protein GCM10010193_25230 [Kitasatospora atroaurantiaca]